MNHQNYYKGMSFTLESLTKSPDYRIVISAQDLIESGHPKHAHFEIVLRQVMK